MMAPPPPRRLPPAVDAEMEEPDHNGWPRTAWAEGEFEERDIRELAEQTAIGSIYLRALISGQLRLSVAVALAFSLVLCAQPLVAWFWPAYSRATVLSIPLPWIVLGALSYPLTVLAGYLYVRRAEAIDHEFGELLE